MIYFYYLINYKYLNLLVFSANFNKNFLFLKKFKKQSYDFKNIKFRKLYTKCLYKLAVTFQTNKNWRFSFKQNWRFNFFNFKKLSPKIYSYSNSMEIVDAISCILEKELFLEKFFNYILSKSFLKIQRKLNLVSLKKFKENLSSVFNSQKKLIKTFSNLSYCLINQFNSLKKKVLDSDIFTIQIRIKKNNIFLIFRNKKKLFFFISAGRIFRGKKKRNYLSGRTLSRTFIKLIIRFLLKQRAFSSKTNINYIFILLFNKTLRHFLIKSILNSFKFYQFPILSLINNLAISHNTGLRQKKVRRL